MAKFRKLLFRHGRVFIGNSPSCSRRIFNVCSSNVLCHIFPFSRSTKINFSIILSLNFGSTNLFLNVDRDVLTDGAREKVILIYCFVFVYDYFSIFFCVPFPVLVILFVVSQ